MNDNIKHLTTYDLETLRDMQDKLDFMFNNMGKHCHNLEQLQIMRTEILQAVMIVGGVGDG